jgi:hypothetical protein
MRLTLVAMFALALLGSAASAASRPITASGCVRAVGKCTLLQTRSDSYFLFGRNLPRPGLKARVTVKGSVRPATSYACPTRLIIRGNIKVTSWTPTRVPCP